MVLVLNRKQRSSFLFSLEDKKRRNKISTESIKSLTPTYLLTYLLITAMKSTNTKPSSTKVSGQKVLRSSNKRKTRAKNDSTILSTYLMKWRSDGRNILFLGLCLFTVFSMFFNFATHEKLQADLKGRLNNKIHKRKGDSIVNDPNDLAKNIRQIHPMQKFQRMRKEYGHGQGGDGQGGQRHGHNQKTNMKKQELTGKAVFEEDERKPNNDNNTKNTPPNNNNNKGNYDETKKIGPGNIPKSTYQEEAKQQRDESILEEIYNGEVDLFDIVISKEFVRRHETVEWNEEKKEKFNPKKIKSKFCKLNWPAYKADPNKIAMFKLLVDRSKCKVASNVRQANFSNLVEKIRTMDSMVAKASKEEAAAAEESNLHPIHVNPPTGFLFHESRCGSTLASNMLVAMDPSKTRMYSESQPLGRTLRSCVENGPERCDVDAVVKLLKDIVYMMGRTKDPNETRLFMKFQPLEEFGLSLLQKAFPETPWIFIYRDPNHVMASNMQDRGGSLNPTKDGKPDKRGPYCTRSRNWKNPPDSLRDLVELRTNGEKKELAMISDDEYCAANLANFCEAALKFHKEWKNPGGVFVNYNQIKEVMIEHVIPHHFGLPVGEEQLERIEQISGVYSKGGNRGNGGANSKAWKDDTEEKEDVSTPGMKSATTMFLQSPYLKMEEVAHQSGQFSVME